MGSRRNTKRWSAGLLAIMLAFVQVIMPVQSAFALEPETPVALEQPVQQAEPVIEEQSLQAPVQPQNFALPQLQVASVTITQNVVCGPANDTLTIVKQNATVTELPWILGYKKVLVVRNLFTVWSDGDRDLTKTFTFRDANTPCDEVIPTPEQPSVTDPCGPANATWNVPVANEADKYVWSLEQGNLIATAKDGFVLANSQKSINFGQAVDSGKACPTVVPCEGSTGKTLVTADNQFADYQDTRSAGHYEFTNDGLHIYTDNASGLAKVAWYHNVNYPLTDVGTPSMNYSSTFGLEPGLQLVVDFDNNGTPDGILVGEAVYGDDWWLSNSAAQFVKDAAPVTGGGSGSAYHGTLNGWLASFPDAQVKAVGFSLGSGVHADGTLRSLTFGCYTWKFGKEQPDTFTPQIYKRDQFGNILTEARFNVEVCQKSHGNNDELLREDLSNWSCMTYTDVNLGTDGSWFANNVQYRKYRSTKVTITETNTPAACTNAGPWVFTWSRNQVNDKVALDRQSNSHTGSWSSGSNVWTLLNNCTPGQGGAGGETTVTQASATLPAELPMTGNGGSLSTWFALLAALVTYGVVYFAQPKKWLED